MADITESVVAGILSTLANPVEVGLPAIEDTKVAEPGPPTGVTRFTGADASGGALAAKIGARVFQRARERREAALKEQKLQLDEDYRRAQIEHLTRTVQSSAPARDQSITLPDGRVISGLTAEERARHEIDLANDPQEYEWDEDLPGGGKAKVKGKIGDYHAYLNRISAEKGRSEAATRLSAALSTRQENNRLRWLTSRLAAMPSFAQITTQAYNDATTDAIAEFETPQEQAQWYGGKKTVQTKYDPQDKAHIAQINVLRQKHYQRRLQERVAADSTARAPYVDELSRGALGGGDANSTSDLALQAILQQIDQIGSTATPDTFTVRR